MKVKRIVPARPSHIPHYAERTILQKLREGPAMPLSRLHPAGRKTIAGMVAKGWVERQIDAHSGARYCITPAGEAALKTKIPEDR